MSIVTSIVGGATGGKGAKKAAKIQAASTAAQIAESRRNQEYLTGLNQPAIDRGNAAGGAYASFLGLNGAGSQQEALDTFRGSTGYQDLLKTGLGSVNANAYARGLGASGATLKRLQERGAAIADQSAQQYLGNLSNLNQTGQQAIGTVAGVAMNTTNNINNATQTAADAKGNAALISAAAWQNAYRNIGKELSGLGSSYMGGGFGG